MKRFIFSILLFILLFSFSISFADGIITEKEYRDAMTMDSFPNIIKVNEWIDCGEYQIRIMGQPLVTASTSKLHAYDDKSFLIVRVGIKNNTEKPVVWLDPESFFVQEYYLDIQGATYGLNSIMSAKASQAYSLPSFFGSLQPEKEFLTVLVFEVYGAVDGWIFNFNPFTRDENSGKDTVSFLLPAALYQ